jgi:hypothetical protein
MVGIEMVSNMPTMNRWSSVDPAVDEHFAFLHDLP